MQTSNAAGRTRGTSLAERQAAMRKRADTRRKELREARSQSEAPSMKKAPRTPPTGHKVLSLIAEAAE